MFLRGRDAATIGSGPCRPSLSCNHDHRDIRAAPRVLRLVCRRRGVRHHDDDVGARLLQSVDPACRLRRRAGLSGRACQQRHRHLLRCRRHRRHDRRTAGRPHRCPHRHRRRRQHRRPDAGVRRTVAGAVAALCLPRRVRVLPRRRRPRALDDGGGALVQRAPGARVLDRRDGPLLRRHPGGAVRGAGHRARWPCRRRALARPGALSRHRAGDADRAAPEPGRAGPGARRRRCRPTAGTARRSRPSPSPRRAAAAISTPSRSPTCSCSAPRSGRSRISTGWPARGSAWRRRRSRSPCLLVPALLGVSPAAGSCSRSRRCALRWP